MRKLEMSDKDALRRIRPRRPVDRRSLRRILLGMILVVLCVFGLLYEKHHQESLREDTWVTAVATIEDARTRVVSMGNSAGGGAMFYDVDVLAKYRVDGVEREQWITIAQFPKLLADARLQIFRIEHKRCFVRWKPADPSHPVAEVT